VWARARTHTLLIKLEFNSFVHIDVLFIFFSVYQLLSHPLQRKKERKKERYSFKTDEILNSFSSADTVNAGMYWCLFSL
jgi:hypothetical protein